MYYREAGTSHSFTENTRLKVIHLLLETAKNHGGKSEKQVLWVAVRRCVCVCVDLETATNKEGKCDQHV